MGKMTPTEQQIVALLEERYRDADKRMADQNWLLEAIELLLRHQIELREELRNAGILR
jgi:hypothetical protein